MAAFNFASVPVKSLIDPDHRAIVTVGHHEKLSHVLTVRFANSSGGDAGSSLGV